MAIWDNICSYTCFMPAWVTLASWTFGFTFSSLHIFLAWKSRCLIQFPHVDYTFENTNYGPGTGCGENTYVTGNALSFTYMIEQSSTLYGSGHVRRIVEPAIRARFRTSVDLSVQKVGRLVHVDPGSIDWDLKITIFFICQFLKGNKLTIHLNNYFFRWNNIFSCIHLLIKL